MTDQPIDGLTAGDNDADADADDCPDDSTDILDDFAYNRDGHDVMHPPAGMHTVGEVLAMRVLLQRGIEQATNNANYHLADYAQDFLDRYSGVHVTLEQYDDFVTKTGVNR